MNIKATTGAKGEAIATDYLRQNDYLICNRNWRSGHYEIDIVATKLGITHIIEVRTRKAGSLLSPEKTITAAKAESIRKAAAAYLQQMRIRGEVMFDLIAIDMFPDGSYDVRMINDIVESGW